MKSKQIIIMNGTGGCGKDTVTDFMMDAYTIYKYSSICKVKEIAAQCGWVGGKSEVDRKFLSDLKLLTTNYNDMPMEDLRLVYEKFMTGELGPNVNDKYSGLKSDYPNAEILIIDIREPAEIEKAVNEFNAITVLITRPEVGQITSNMSDANVNNFTYDYEIINDGTLSDLESKVYDFIDWLKERWELR